MIQDREKRNKVAREWRKKNKEKVKGYTDKWREKNRESYLAKKIEWFKNHKESEYNRLKEKKRMWKSIVINHYCNNNPRCMCCGETTYEFLTIEHLNGGGCKHRKEIGASNICRWIINNGFPKEFSILCYNCNCSKAYCGECPHTKVVAKKK